MKECHLMYMYRYILFAMIVIIVGELDHIPLKGALVNVVRCLVVEFMQLRAIASDAEEGVKPLRML